MNLIKIGALALMLQSSNAMTSEFTLHISNIDDSRPGDIVVFLFSQEGFPKDHAKAITLQRQPANKKTLQFHFGVSLEIFAIKVLHDENGDGNVTKNWTGIFPREGLGFSNGATLGLGPPSFKRSMLRRSELTNIIDIPLRY